MKYLKKRHFLVIVMLLVPILSVAQRTYDVVVYGATPSGIAAAVNAANEGMQVALYEPTQYFGGLLTGGMSNTDFKTFESIGGTYFDFMSGIEKYYAKKYGPDSQQVSDCYKGAWYEPHVAEKVLMDMLTETGRIKLFLEHRLTKTHFLENDGKKQLTAISIAKEQDSIKVSAKVFIDATYEGDLMAMAESKYRVGRESRAEYGELFAGVKYYENGRLLIGSSGEGDHKIQCYNFRVCVTDEESNRVEIGKPEKYRREQFLPLLALLKTGEINAFEDQIVKIRRIPNNKADVNDLLYSPISLRMPGENYEWPDGDAEVRREIFNLHKNYTLGLFYFLRTDSEVPQNIREEVAKWGLPRDEFVSTDHFPPALYIREGRRMVSDFVIKEEHTQPTDGQIRAPLQQDAIAICDYSLDSHGNALAGTLYPKKTEGVFNRFVQPYQIPYSVTVPSNIDGLLVSCAVSASHVAYSSLRMEPTWTAIGQATGIAAAVAVKNKVNARDIDLSIVQSKLHKVGAKTIYLSDVPASSPHFELLQFFGTQGYFHLLPEYRNQNYIGRGTGEGMRGQHIRAYPFHDANIFEIMQKELAETWLDLADINDLNLAYEGKTRLQFLQEIFKASKR